MLAALAAYTMSFPQAPPEWVVNGYRIHMSGEALEDGPERLTISDARGMKVAQVEYHHVTIERIADLTGEGVPDIVVQGDGVAATYEDATFFIFELGSKFRCLAAIHKGAMQGEGVDFAPDLAWFGFEHPLHLLKVPMNLYHYWIGPRGGAMIPVVLTYRDHKFVEDTLRFTFRLQQVVRDSDEGRPGAIRVWRTHHFGDAHERWAANIHLIYAALPEYGCTYMLGGRHQALARIRRHWPHIIYNFIRVNEAEIDGRLAWRKSRVWHPSGAALLHLVAPVD